MSEQLSFPEVTGVLAPLETTIPEVREWVLQRPGNINYADPRGAYPGCKLVHFDSVDEANDFFTNRAGLLVLNIDVTQSGIWMLISKQMDEEEMEEMNEYSTHVNAKMQEFRARKDAEKQAAADAEKKAADEQAAFLKEAKQALKEIGDLRKAHEELKAKYADIKKKLKAAGK